MHPTPIRTLIVLKLRQAYYELSHDLENVDKQQVATGMFNSATFVSDMLQDRGIESKVVVVVDNNCIDREVTAFRPTHVFVEGYWVVPEKFDQLKPLHPTVQWIVRCHSEMPFLAQEGIAIDWTYKYLSKGIKVAGNSPRINEELRVMADQFGFGWEEDDVRAMVPMLPNYYPVSVNQHHIGNTMDEYIDIGCFGAVRPLKNHLLQAVAAVKFAKKLGKKLRFHINQGRIEMFGANALKNIRAMFDRMPDHELVEHAWTGHTEFLEIIASMDMCMQVSFTETFNIVTADAVSVGCPVVGSAEISWAYPIFADPTSSQNIYETMLKVWNNRSFYKLANIDYLIRFSKNSAKRWVNYLERS